MKRGCFITIEGGEGAGKTTCMRHVAGQIQQHGLELIQTREPGGTELGEDLRALLLGHQYTGMGTDTELLLMFAARAEHIQRKIEPALAAGQWVLCDRFTDATYAYQGAGRGVSLERMAILQDWVQGDLRPDLTLLLDLPVEQGMYRARQRSAPDRFESEARTFFERVRQGYLDIAARYPERVKVIDASRELAQVQAAITAVIHPFLHAHA